MAQATGLQVRSLRPKRNTLEQVFLDALAAGNRKEQQAHADL